MSGTINTNENYCICEELQTVDRSMD